MRSTPKGALYFSLVKFEFWFDIHRHFKWRMALIIKLFTFSATTKPSIIPGK